MEGVGVVGACSQDRLRSWVVVVVVLRGNVVEEVGAAG